MTNFVLLAVSLLAGILLRRLKRFPESAPVTLNSFIIHISLPAAALLHLHRVRLESSLVYAAVMPWLVFAGAAAFFYLVGKLLRLPRPTVGALMMVGGLGNTSFVGLPMIETWYGKEFISIGIIADQLGSFLALSTIGILTAVAYSSGEVSWRQMVRKVLYFPPFQALVLAILLRPVPFPEVVEGVLEKLAGTITPLALVSVGLQLRFIRSSGIAVPLALGLMYKLALAPALVALLYVGLLGAGGDVVSVAIFEAAMAPMITAGIIAVDHDLDPPLVALMVGIGIPLSFLTLPAWRWLLQGV